MNPSFIGSNAFANAGAGALGVAGFNVNAAALSAAGGLAGMISFYQNIFRGIIYEIILNSFWS